MKWHKIIWSAVAATALVAGAVQARDHADPHKLIAQWQAKNTLCRGLHGSDPRTQPACDERQRLGRELYRIGWCYGETGQMAYQMQWHRCHENSSPYEE